MMKQLRRMVVVGILFSILTVNVAYASAPVWKGVETTHSEGILLKNGERYSEDSFEEYARGTILSAGILRITNEEDGTLHITVETFAHKEVDTIYQTVFLDEWDEDREDWKQIGKWDFEKTKEESEDEIFAEYHVGFTVTGCQPNRYYRARAMHLVEWGDEAEAKVTQTNGVLLTDHEV